MDPNETSFFFGSRNTLTPEISHVKQSQSLASPPSKSQALNALDNAWEYHQKSTSRFNSPAPARFINTTNLTNSTQKNLENVGRDIRKLLEKPAIYQDFMKRRESASFEIELPKPRKVLGKSHGIIVERETSPEAATKTPIKTPVQVSRDAKDSTKTLLKTIHDQRLEIERLKQKNSLATPKTKEALSREWKHLGNAIYNAILELCDLVLLMNQDFRNPLHQKRQRLINAIHQAMIPPPINFSPSYLLQGCTILSAILKSHRQDLAMFFKGKDGLSQFEHLESLVSNGLEDSVLLEAEFS